MAVTISFAAAVSNPFGLADVGDRAQPIFVDIDGDADLDAFVGAQDGTVYYVQNTGTATAAAFAAAVANTFALGGAGTLSSPTFSDLDGDEDLDAVVGYQDGSLRFYLNTGTRNQPAFQLTTAAGLTVQSAGSYAMPLFADIDHDGDADLLSGAANVLFYYQNTGSIRPPAFTFERGLSTFGLGGGNLARPDLSLADLDADGDLDAIIGYGPADSVRYLENFGTASAPLFGLNSATLPFGLGDFGGTGYAAPAFADIDADGDQDLFFGRGDGTMVFHENTTPGTVKIVESNGSTAVTEGNGAIDFFTIVLTLRPTADVTVTFGSTGNQIQVLTESVTFTAANWNIPVRVNLQAVNDTLAEGTPHLGNITFTVSSSGPDYDGLAVAPLEVSITDNDPPNNVPVFNAPEFNLYGLSDAGSSASAGLVDIDGDGDVDAFLGNQTGDFLFAENVGSATSPQFAAYATNPFGLSQVSYFSRPVFGDLDSDGDVDLISGSFNGDLLYFQNTGSATDPQFDAALMNEAGLAAGGSRSMPTLGDLDGDGDLDLLVGYSSGDLLYAENTGSASVPAFAPAVANFAGLDTGGINTVPAFVDIEGDGDLDVFLTDINGAIRYFRNTGSATAPAFASGATSAFGLSTSSGATSLAFADVNGDGFPEALRGTSDGNVYVHRNLTPAIVVSASNGGTAVSEAGATDTFQVFLTAFPTSDVTITLSVTDGQLAPNVTTLVFSPVNWEFPRTVTVSAVDDSVAEGQHTGVIQFSVTSADAQYNNFVLAPLTAVITDNDLPVGTPSFANPVVNPLGLADAGNFASPALADLDADGDLDMLLGLQAGGFAYLENTGSVTAADFGAPVVDGLGLGATPGRASPAFADIDGDGDFDVLAGNSDGRVEFFENIGGASSAAFAAAVSDVFGLADVGAFAHPSFADLDDDGDLDALIGASSGDLAYFENIGSATAADFTGAQTNPFGLSNTLQHAAPSLVDVDGDGDLDLFVGTYTGYSLFFENMGSAIAPAFAAPAAFSFGLDKVGSYATPAFADLDSDSDLDVVFGSADGSLTVQTNTIGSNANPVIAPLAPLVFVDTPFDDAFATQSFPLSATDADGNPLVYGIEGAQDLGTVLSKSDGFAGTLVLDKITHVLTYTPSDDALEAQSADDARQFILTVSDGTGTSRAALAITLNESGDTETTGDDNLTGTAGNDRFNGLAGNDLINALGGNDTIKGGAGADTMIGGTGNDTYYVDSTGDIVTEAASGGTADVVFSALANYTLKSNVEIGRVDGSGNVNLTGNLLANSLFGGTGKNILTGGLGADKLTGGTSADRFDFNLATESGLTATTRDQVLDFSHAQGDKLDLAGIDANTGKAGDQAFTKLLSSNTAFSPTKSFTAAGQLYYDQKADVLYGNTDADAAPEFTLKVMGPASLVVGDFIL